MIELIGEKLRNVLLAPVVLLAMVVSSACNGAPPPAVEVGEMTLELAQALVDDYYLDVSIVVEDMHVEDDGVLLSATAGSYWPLEIELAESQTGWWVKEAAFEGRPLREAAPGIILEPLYRGIDELRAGNTMSAMGYMAEKLEEMRSTVGRYPSSLEELAELGYLDLLYLDETTHRATSLMRMREEHPNAFPVGELVDAWGMAWVYATEEGTYVLRSCGSDGVPGPTAPDPWLREPFDVDLIMVDGEFVQAPRDLASSPRDLAQPSTSR